MKCDILKSNNLFMICPCSSLVYIILNGKTECIAEAKIAKHEAGEAIMGYLVDPI